MYVSPCSSKDIPGTGMLAFLIAYPFVSSMSLSSWVFLSDWSLSLIYSATNPAFSFIYRTCLFVSSMFPIWSWISAVPGSTYPFIFINNSSSIRIIWFISLLRRSMSSFFDSIDSWFNFRVPISTLCCSSVASASANCIDKLDNDSSSLGASG